MVIDLKTVLALIVLGGALLIAVYHMLPGVWKARIKNILLAMKEKKAIVPLIIQILKAFNIDVNQGATYVLQEIKKQLKAKLGVEFTDSEWATIGREVVKNWNKIYKEVTGEDWEDNITFTPDK